MEETAKKFMDVFSGLERAHGVYEITGQKNTAKGIKRDGRGRTLQEPLTGSLEAALSRENIHWCCSFKRRRDL